MDRHELVVSASEGSLLPNPLRGNRTRCPKHNYAAGLADRVFDGTEPVLATDDFPVPPNGEALFLQNVFERSGKRAVLLRIAEEYVPHGRNCALSAHPAASERN